MPTDREGAKQFVTQQLTKLKEKVDKAQTSLSEKSAAEGVIASAMGSSGTAATASKSASDSKDEQDDEQSVKEKPFGASKNIHTLNSFRTGSSKKVKYIRGNIAGFSN